LAFLADKGAELFAGSLEDAAFLTSAYRGVDAVFAMIPPHLQAEDYLSYAGQIGATHVQALRKADVKYIVALSSIGAHLESGSGIVLALHNFEQQLQALSDANILVLRPSYFMDNVFMQIDIIKNFGLVGSPIAPDVSQPFVATQDIGDTTAKRLSALDFSGHTTEYVLGERNLSYTEVTGVLAGALHKAGLKYVQFPYSDTVKAMVRMGLSENIAGLLVDLSEGINNGKVLEEYVRTAENTTRTSIEEFAESFARLFNQE
ncbi:MAG: NAD(P)H-binding protein, partial [Candidatus Latescibacterota bacterium]